MKAEIISIGDELLIGQVINTNSAWLAQQFNLLGINIEQITVVADTENNILESLNQASERADIIVMTGGLGPTKDDITKKTLCKFFGNNLVFNPEAYKDIEHFFALRGVAITELNRLQAEVPENCVLLPNKSGTAPGMWFDFKNKIYISLPGVPFEMKELIIKEVFPKLIEKNITSKIIHKTVLTAGIGESFLADLIANWEDNLPKIIKLAYLPAPGMVRLRLTALGNNDDILKALITKEIEKLIKLIPQYIYGYDDETLEEIIGKLLLDKSQTLAIAESCTGGFISHRITSVAGCSNYFVGSIIAYSNKIKLNNLNIQHKTLEIHGAVSKEVAEEMALNCKKLFNSDFALATTGIAGPGGGSSEKPVGTVWIAIATPSKIYSRKFQFGDNRERNILRASVSALSLLIKQIIADQESTSEETNILALPQW